MRTSTPLSAEQQSYIAISDAVGSMKEHEEEPKVKPLELFSDLVFVVALNIVAASLEAETDLISFGIYLMRIFLLWHMVRRVRTSNSARLLRRQTSYASYVSVWLLGHESGIVVW